MRCDPQLFDRPPLSPVGGGELVVWVGAGVRWGVQLVEGLDGKARRAQQPDPLAVAGMELNLTALLPQGDTGLNLLVGAESSGGLLTPEGSAGSRRIRPGQIQ